MAISIHQLHPPAPRMLPFAWMPVAVGLCVAAPVVVLLQGSAQWTALAVIEVSVVWAQIVSFVAWAGAGSLVIGRQAETSTADVLARVGKQGGHVLHSASMAAGHHIDHIAIGPRGLVVIETKWRRELTDQDLDWAAWQAFQGRREVAGVLRPVLGDVPVTPLIVVWGPTDPAVLPGEVRGVEVVHGSQLAAWLDARPADQLTADQVAAAHARILPQLQARADHERASLTTRRAA